MNRDSVVENIRSAAANIAQYTNRKLVIGVVVLVLLIVFAVRFQIVYIDVRVPHGSSERAVATAMSPGESYSIGGSGLKLLSRDVSSISVAAGSQSASIAPTPAPWYRFRYVRFDLSYAHDASKVAYQNLLGSNCATYDDKRQSLLSYNCANPVGLFEYHKNSDGDWVEDSHADLDYLNQTALPYLGGVLGLRPFGDNAPDGAVVAYRADSSPVSYPIPKELANTDPASVKLMTHFTDPSDSAFVLSDNRGTVYVASANPGKQAVSYQTHEAPAGYPGTALFETTCRPTGERTYCYRGERAIGHGTDHTAKPYEYISIYERDGQAKDYPLKNIQKLDSFYATDSGEIYATKDNSLYRLRQSGDSYKPQLVAAQASGLAAGRALYFVYADGVYRVDPANDQATLVFYSPNVHPVSAFLAGGTTYVLGRLDGSDSESATTYAYKLSTSTYDGAKPRALDILPAASGILPRIGSQSLVGNQYHATANLPINKTNPSAPPVDPEELAAIKAQLGQALRKKGIDPASLDITVGY